MDVHVRLTRRGDLSMQIYRQLLEAVLDGRLRPGERLPPTRELARRLEVSRNTVGVAYERLVADGVVAGRAGAGSFVSGEPLRRAQSRRAPAGAVHPRDVWHDIPTTVSTPVSAPVSASVLRPSLRPSLRLLPDVRVRLYLRLLLPVHLYQSTTTSASALPTRRCFRSPRGGGSSRTNFVGRARSIRGMATRAVTRRCAPRLHVIPACRAPCGRMPMT